MSIVGLDVGTSRVKAVRFDAAWSEVDSESEDTVVLSAPGGRREQDLDQVWEAVARVLRAVVSRSPDDVDAVRRDGPGRRVLAGRRGRPPSRARAAVERLPRLGPHRAVAPRRHPGPVLPHLRQPRGPGAGQRAAAMAGRARARPARPGPPSAQLRQLVFSRLTGEAVLERTEAVNPFCDARTGSTPTACSTCSVSPTSATCYRRSCPAPTPCGRSPGPRRTTWASRSARPSCSRRTTW